MLLGSDFDKAIPSFAILNRMFLAGSYPRAGEWEPFEIDDQEYQKLVKYLISLPLSRPYRTIDNT